MTTDEKDSFGSKAKNKFKSALSAAKDSLVPKLTIRTDAVADKLQNAAESLVEPGKSGLIRHDGEITENPNAKGFAFEHHQVASFNADAALKGRSEERRVGKECVSTGKTRWTTDH